MKKFWSTLISITMVMALLVGCGTSTESSDAAPSGGSSSTSESSGARTVEEREDAPVGVSLTPESYTSEQLPGLENIGVKPLKKYKIAFSNGDMSNDWRAAFFNEFVECGEYLKEEFGCEFIYANSGADSAKQLQDIQSLLAQNPDILIFSPNESAPLTPVADMCESLGIPYITIDRSIDATVGEGMYVANIEGDNFRLGVAMGIEMVKGLTEKNGEPAGNVAEITGGIGSTPGIQRSAGIRHVLKDYPDIKMVQVVDGNWDVDTAYKAAQDIMTAHGDELDGLFCSFDSGTMQAINVAEVQGIDDLVYVSADGDTTFMRDYVLTGKAQCCVEYPPYYGITALEYAIQYLNGNDIPSFVLLSQRLYTTETEEKAAALKELTDKCTEAGDPFVPATYGMYDVFSMTGELWEKYYPVNWVDGGGTEFLNTLIPEDPFNLINNE